MSPAALAAGGAGACAVGATWELLATIERSGSEAALARLLRPLRRPGRAATAAEARRLARTAAVALFGAGWLLFGLLPGLALAAGGPWGVRRLLAARAARWRAAVAAQTALVARALADALVGGHSVRGAIEQAARHGGVVGPARELLAGAAAQLAAGSRTEVVLERLRATVDHPSWDTLTAAILLARDTGGDLAGLLRSLATAAERARQEEGDARAAVAQARLTARIVAGLPLVAAGLAELAQPDLLATVLGDPRSLALLCLAVVLQAGAMLAIRRIVTGVAR
jgi:tight adherence protein B